MGCFLKFFSLYLWYDRNYIITGISLHIIFLCGIPIRKEGREMGSQSKRMMNAKQDQYREYVIEKLLAETTIGIVNDSSIVCDPNNRFITIKTPFISMFTVITPKDGEHRPQQHVWSKIQYNGATPQGFPILMAQYAITESHEVSKVWLQYKSIVGSMIHDEVEKQKTL
jgi:hypothetical protein